MCNPVLEKFIVQRDKTAVERTSSTGFKQSHLLARHNQPKLTCFRSRCVPGGRLGPARGMRMIVTEHRSPPRARGTMRLEENGGIKLERSRPIRSDIERWQGRFDRARPSEQQAADLLPCISFHMRQDLIECDP